jgi:hypothetical protein
MFPRILLIYVGSVLALSQPLHNTSKTVLFTPSVANLPKTAPLKHQNRRTAPPRAIDENRSLPYKPGQLSAMTRLVRKRLDLGPAAARFGPDAHRPDILDNLNRQIADWQLALSAEILP